MSGDEDGLDAVEQYLRDELPEASIESEPIPGQGFLLRVAAAEFLAIRRQTLCPGGDDDRSARRRSKSGAALEMAGSNRDDLWFDFAASRLDAE